MEKRKFRYKLDTVYVALCKYLDEKADYEINLVVGDIRLRYAIILAAVHDLHYGDDAQKADAAEYFAGNTYIKHKNECIVPSEILDAIVNNAKDYTNYISYKTYEELLEDGDWL
jgi:hypothetical protein